MIHCVFPRAGDTGWGVVGRSLTRALQRRCGARLVSAPFNPQDSTDPLAEHELLLHRTDLRSLFASGGSVPWPTLQAIRNTGFVPLEPRINGTQRLGYTFFEKDRLSDIELGNLRSHFDAVFAGSSWCAEILQRHGVPNVSTAVQGVDRTLFHPLTGKSCFEDRFVVFSGGKLELRKGQDLVIKAFKILRERHRDVLLVNAWHNCIPGSMQSIAASPHIDVPPLEGTHVEVVERLLARNGIDPMDALTLPAQAHIHMARYYRESDVGVFPNRCEGGTNLVLMEYQACGRPAIATLATGHADVLDDAFGLPLVRSTPLRIDGGVETISGWVEPNLDELVEQLEWAYQHRGELELLGSAAAVAMEAWSWDATAQVVERATEYEGAFA